jgi:FAD/FMN-containing dehydrogenase
MHERTGIEQQNWFGDIRWQAGVLARPGSGQDIRAVVRNPERYPSPVRALGAAHSMTECVVADSGTVLDMTGMDRIIAIGAHTVTVEAGALYLDVARALQRHGLQFHVNIEMGDLSMGAAACTHTKDASFPGEYGMASSYCIGMKVVTHEGELLEITEEQPELLQAMRTSYGLLGIVYEVTFRVRPIRPLAVYHRTFRLDDFLEELPALWASGESMMYYLVPFRDRITVEFRTYLEQGTPTRSLVWTLRNAAWKTIVPGIARTISTRVPTRRMRHLLHEGVGWSVQKVLNRLRNRNTIATDQMMRYPKRAGYPAYIASVWAFPEEEYPRVVREYFAFCKRHYREHDYRPDLLSVGYRFAQDRSSLFSYAYDGPMMSADPVSTGGPGWRDFLAAYNDLCSRDGGKPLFNQTPWLTREQVERAYGERLATFREHQRHLDPRNRFLNRHFAEILGRPGGGGSPVPGDPDAIGSTFDGTGASE